MFALTLLTCAFASRNPALPTAPPSELRSDEFPQALVDEFTYTGPLGPVLDDDAALTAAMEASLLDISHDPERNLQLVKANELNQAREQKETQRLAEVEEYRSRAEQLQRERDELQARAARQGGDANALLEAAEVNFQVGPRDVYPPIVVGNAALLGTANAVGSSTLVHGYVHTTAGLVGAFGLGAGLGAGTGCCGAAGLLCFLKHRQDKHNQRIRMMWHRHAANQERAFQAMVQDPARMQQENTIAEQQRRQALQGLEVQARPDGAFCVVCMQNLRTHMALHSNGQAHLIYCEGCARTMGTRPCAVCQQAVTAMIDRRTYSAGRHGDLEIIES